MKKFILVFKIFSIIFVILPVGAFAKEVIGDYVVEFDQKVEADTDGNGKNDRASYYLREQLVWSAFDDDEDGAPDLWLRYKNGDVVDLEIFDPDGDSNPDKIAEFGTQEKREVIYDASAEFDNGSVQSIIFWIIAAFLAGGAGYWFWKKRRNVSMTLRDTSA